MERVWTAYLKLLGEVIVLRADQGEEVERVVEELAPSASDVNKLKQGLEENKRKVRRVNEALTERERALVQAEVEKEAAMYAKHQLDEEHASLIKLQEEVSHLKESSSLIQSLNAFLESEAYRQEVIEEYHQGLTGKTEVAIACKAGYDYLSA